MGLVWVICGAGRCVGKTTLALRLCEVLPANVYAKQGHGKPRADKHGNFFHSLDELESFVEASRESAEHVVVECNQWALENHGDITIFVDGIPGATRFRDDTPELKVKANLLIAADVSPATWKRPLQTVLESKEIIDTVCVIMAEHRRYFFGHNPKVLTKVWFEKSGSHVFGSGLARLLENVDRLGSLQDAARAANMSYRYAWNLISAAEKHLGRMLVLRQAGGCNGGSSSLCDDGRRMLDAFRRLDREVADFADERFLAILDEDKSDA